MTDLGTAVSYLVAVVELAEVKSIRNAIKANLVAAGGVEGALGTITNAQRVRLDRRPAPDFHPAQRLTGYSAPYQVKQSTPRIERIVERVPPVPAINATFETSCEPRPQDGSKPGPLVPPWRMPLIPKTSHGPVIIKSQPKPPDVINKGSLLDFFM